MTDLASTLEPGVQGRALPRLMRDYGRELGLLAAIVIIGAVVGYLQPRFLSHTNLVSILSSNAFIGIAAIGMSMVIILGHIDVSVGAIIGVCAIVAGALAKAGYPFWLAWSAPLLVGMLLSLVNGLLVTVARIPAIVATLGTASIMKGGLIMITAGNWIFGLPPDFLLAQKRLFGLQVSVYIMVAVTVAVAFWMRMSATGRSIYAIGGNAAAARATGIDAVRVTLLVFALHGVLAGVAGILYGTQMQAIQSVAPAEVELTVIAAAVIGGVSILGGTGTVVGSTLATLFFALVNSALIFLSVSAYWLRAVQGLLILATLLIDVARRNSR